MAQRTLILAAEVSVASGVGNSTTVGSAKCVRVFNSSGSDLTITVTDPTGANTKSGAGSISMPDNTIEFIEKEETFTIQEQLFLEVLLVELPTSQPFLVHHIWGNSL